MKAPAALKLGTRGSDLALWQARTIQSELEKIGISVELEIVQTTGDLDQRDFRSLGGDGFFTKTIEKALLDGHIDMAIHSCKDLPSQVHSKAPWFAVLERETPRDILIVKSPYKSQLENILSRVQCQTQDLADHTSYVESPTAEASGGTKKKLLVGTSSPRRTEQIKSLSSLIDTRPHRGNVPTRIQKLKDSSDLHAICIAEAGFKRLRLAENRELMRDLAVLTVDWPTGPCQGILALQVRKEQAEIIRPLINHELTVIAHLEKRLLEFLGGGCHLPLGFRLTDSPTKKSAVVFFSQVFGKGEANLSLIRPKSHRLSSAFGKAYKAQSWSKLFQDIYEDLLANVLINGSKDAEPSFVSDNKISDRVWLTQPLSSQLPVFQAFRASGFAALSLPLTTIESCWNASEIAEQGKFTVSENFLFLSPTSARIFVTDIWPLLARQTTAPKLWAVGAATAKALSELKLKIAQAPESSAAELVQALSDEGIDSCKVFGTIESKIFVPLEKANIRYEFFATYQSMENENALAERIEEIEQNDWLFFSQPKAVEIFVRQSKRWEDLSATAHFLAIGQTTAQALKHAGAKDILVPERNGDWKSLVKLAKDKSAR